MRLASVALIAVALLAGCGSGDDDSQSTTTVQAATWNGPPAPAEDGTISTAGFNEHAQTLPVSQRVPEQLALEFLQVESQAYMAETDTRPGGTRVTVTQDDLEDDSVRVRRYVLEFSLVAQGAVNLSSARVDYKCHEGRGHQDFSPELCL